MDSTKITTAQAEVLKRHTRPMLRYLGAMLKRMHKRRFPPQDELLRSTQKAYNAVHELNVRIHYLSCSGGVGTPGKQPRKYERGLLSMAEKESGRRSLPAAFCAMPSSLNRAT